MTRPVAGGSVSAAPAGIFASIAPATPHYATLPELEGFNWSECLSAVDSGRWFLVTFRSIRKADADDALLTEYDDRAFAEALGTSGLLCYFRGELDDQRRCLSFCVWERPEQARDASLLPEHQLAAHLARAFYESYAVRRYWLVKRPGAEAPELLPLA
jgi:hypothetical protein